MTLATNDNRKNFVGNGVTTIFAFNFKTYDIADIDVFFDAIEQFAGFTVTLNADQESSPGGEVEFTVAPGDPAPDEIIVTILRYLDTLQNVDYAPYTSFPSDTHEVALDEIHMLIQQLADETNRALISAVDTDLAVSYTLPVALAGYVIGWNGAGTDLTNYNIGDFGSFIVTPYIETLLDDINSIEARATLEAAGLLVANTFTKPQTWSYGADLDDADIEAVTNILTVGADGNTFNISGIQQIDEIATLGVGTEIEIRFTTARTLTHSSDFVLPGAADIPAAIGDIAKFKEFAVGDWRCTNYIRASGVGSARSPRNHIAGLEIISNAITPNTDIDISIGEAINSTNEHTLTILSALIRETDNQLGIGNGGMSSSLNAGGHPLANTTYYIHLIRTGAINNIAFDISASAANLITDHSVTEYRQIGTFDTNSGNTNIDVDTVRNIGNNIRLGVIIGAEISKVVVSDGSQGIGVVSSWTPSAGIYNWVQSTAAIGIVIIQLYISSSWRGHVNAKASGGDRFDGSNMRIFNNGVASETIHYQTF